MLKKIFTLGLLCSTSISMLALSALELDDLKAELNALAPVNRRVALRARKAQSETAKALIDAKERLTRDEVREWSRLQAELDYLNSLELAAPVASEAPSPDGSKSDGASSDADGGYILTAEERARLDKITSQVKLKLERARIERDLKSELDKPARHKNQNIIAKLSAEIIYIDAKLAVAGRDVYGAKS